LAYPIDHWHLVREPPAYHARFELTFLYRIFMKGVVLDTRTKKRPRTENETQTMAAGQFDAQDTNHLSSGRFPLPTELVFEIISRLSDDSKAVYEADIEDEKQYDARQSALRALSQTSQMLRAICLPLLWERVDLHEPGRWGGEDWAGALCTRLDRIATGLITNPTLAAYVRFVVAILVCVKKKLADLGWYLYLAYSTCSF
jgi:hypothetical protein